MRILLTGASGFLGGAVAGKLAPKHDLVTAGRSRVQPGGDHLTIDLSQPFSRQALPERIDCVIHLAQSLNYRAGFAAAPDLFAVNVGSTVALLEWAAGAGAQSFVFASTGSVYGIGDTLGEEDGMVDVAGQIYPASKLAAEAMVTGYAGRLRTTSLRFFTLYGPGQKSGMVAGIAQRVAAAQPVSLHGDDGLLSQPTYIDDAVTVVERAAMSSGWNGCVNVAGPEPIGLRQMAMHLGAELRVVPTFVSNPEPAPRYRLPSRRRLQALMPDHVFVTPSAGLRRMVRETVCN